MVDGGGGNNVDELTAAARAGAYDAVIAGGGDGTLNTIANRLAGGTVPFGVLPLGTHNHFAKDQNVPLDLDAAVAALADAVAERRFADLDVGEVNGRIFLNASAIGLHPEFVKERDAHYEVVGRFAVPPADPPPGAEAPDRRLRVLPEARQPADPAGAARLRRPPGAPRHPVGERLLQPLRDAGAGPGGDLLPDPRAAQRLRRPRDRHAGRAAAAAEGTVPPAALDQRPRARIALPPGLADRPPPAADCPSPWTARSSRCNRRCSTACGAAG